MFKAMIYAALIVWLYNRYIKPKPPVKKVAKSNPFKTKINKDVFAKRLLNIGLELKEINSDYNLFLTYSPLPLNLYDIMIRRLRLIRNDLAANRHGYLQLTTPKQSEAQLAATVDNAILECDLLIDKIKDLLRDNLTNK